MKDEYIIINKTAILKRIEELKPISEYNERVGEYDSEGEIISELEYILSQSIPLIPEIEKAFDAGFHKGYNVGQADAQSHPLSLTIANHIHNDRQDYISNLKLDI